MGQTLAGYLSESLTQDGKQNSIYTEVLNQPQRVSEMDQPLLNHDTVISYHPTGSRYICNPPVIDTDEDWVVLVKSEMYPEFADHLEVNNFWQSNAGYSRTDFISYRSILNNDNRNIIVTFDPEWYQLFVEATEIAKDENLLHKVDRIALFELIMAKVRKKEERAWQKEKEKREQLNQMARESMIAQQTLYNQYVNGRASTISLGTSTNSLSTVQIRQMSNVVNSVSVYPSQYGNR